MDYAEALEWLKGNRSLTNVIPFNPRHTWIIRIAQADAAQTEQAYWIVRAYQDLKILRQEKR